MSDWHWISRLNVYSQRDICHFDLLQHWFGQLKLHKALKLQHKCNRNNWFMKILTLERVHGFPYCDQYTTPEYDYNLTILFSYDVLLKVLCFNSWNYMDWKAPHAASTVGQFIAPMWGRDVVPGFHAQLLHDLDAGPAELKVCLLTHSASQHPRQSTGCVHVVPYKSLPFQLLTSSSVTCPS